MWLSGQCLGLAIQQSSLGFKFLSDHLLGLLSVIPSSNPLPRLCVNSHWLPPASWVFLILPLCSVWVISCYKSFEWGACRLAGQFKHCVTTGGHFAGACVHLLNDNSVGASNLIAGNRKKLAWRYRSFKNHLVGALITVLSYKKFLRDENGTLSTRVFHL